MPLNGEERKAWSEWYRNPRGADSHLTSIGSRARPVSIGANATDIDELVEQMVKRGVLARDEPKPRKSALGGSKGVRATIVSSEIDKASSRARRKR